MSASRLDTQLAAELADIAAAGLTRRRRVLDSPAGRIARVDGQEVLNFASNDYLGLAGNAEIAQALADGALRWGAGSGASHLVSGHLTPHDQLENEIAAFTGFERALTFSTGYLANLAVTPTLAGRGDAVFADKLNHASLIDAMQLAKANGADVQRYPHNDVAALKRLLSASTARNKLIVTDAVFSMDGDIAPLPELLELAVAHDALLVIDDAHGFGVLGYRGKGSLEHFNLLKADGRERIVYMATLGKAAGGYGAFVAGGDDVVEWILQSARTYIFTTATPPAIAAAMAASLEVMQEDRERLKHLRTLIDFFSDSLKLHYARLPFSQTAIQPVIIGANATTLAFAEALRERHMFVPAIRPPTVPAGTARLRVSLSAAMSADDLFDLITAITDLENILMREPS